MLKSLFILVEGVFICVFIISFASCSNITNNSSNPSYPSSSFTPGLGSLSPITGTTSGSPVSLQILNVAVAITPVTLQSVDCGSSIDVNLTATIYANVGNSGGTVNYTWNINNSLTHGSVAFEANEAKKEVTYNISNVLIQYNQVNIAVVFTVNTPNTLTTPLAKVAGNCTFPGAFVVTGVSVGVSPASVANIVCGTTITVTYTATISAAADSNGGVVLLQWHFPRFNHQAKVIFSPGVVTQTTTYVITTKLARNVPLLSAWVTSTTPNVLASNQAGPTGICV